MATSSHDTIIEILCCLSVKDQLWCSWMEDPYFIKLHLSYSLKTNTNHSLILRYRKFQFLSVNYDSPKTTRRLKQPFGEQKKPIQILGSCNGLLAVEYYYNRIFVWNLSTRKYQVYSLRSNCWRRIKDFCFYLIFYRELGFLANNVLHWMVFKTRESSNRNLVGFDLRSEEFRLVELPDFCLDENIYFDVKAMGGYLCLTATHRELNDVVVDVWIMKEYGVKESWVKLMSSTQPDLLPGSPFEVPLAFSKNGNKVLFHNKYSRGNRDSLVWYDLGSKRVEKVGIKGVPVVYDVYLYVESLFPVNKKPHRVLRLEQDMGLQILQERRIERVRIRSGHTCFDELVEKKLVVMEGCSNYGSMSRLNMIKLKSCATVLSYSCCNGGPEPDHCAKLWLNGLIECSLDTWLQLNGIPISEFEIGVYT
ncbi:hypothetical protein GOBAR_AA05975 [Gossypium barbadense]|uniref:F-box associated beta-propeller type 1 domain-containing protein n=1 Tax=Gossypium barbadense TaxID=3634 RepID=A0A2P5YG83_GOSBA|nr:hypothetical protein GOBAR_AA05975 [Gossypium barbadense]